MCAASAAGIRRIVLTTTTRSYCKRRPRRARARATSTTPGRAQVAHTTHTHTHSTHSSPRATHIAQNTSRKRTSHQRARNRVSRSHLHIQLAASSARRCTHSLRTNVVNTSRQQVPKPHRLIAQPQDTHTHTFAQETATSHKNATHTHTLSGELNSSCACTQ